MTSAKLLTKPLTPLGLHWQTTSPFLFCAYHYDKYPGDGDGRMGVAKELLRGRDLGSGTCAGAGIPTPLVTALGTPRAATKGAPP
jgi:hypothetical protein